MFINFLQVKIELSKFLKAYLLPKEIHDKYKSLKKTFGMSINSLIVSAMYYFEENIEIDKNNLDNYDK